MDIGSLVQGLQAGVPAAAMPSAQVASEEDGATAFGEILEGDAEAPPQPDLVGLPMWSAVAPSGVALPLTVPFSGGAALTRDENELAVDSAPEAARSLPASGVAVDIRSAAESSFLLKADSRWAEIGAPKDPPPLAEGMALQMGDLQQPGLALDARQAQPDAVGVAPPADAALQTEGSSLPRMPQNASASVMFESGGSVSQAIEGPLDDLKAVLQSSAAPPPMANLPIVSQEANQSPAPIVSAIPSAPVSASPMAPKAELGQQLPAKATVTSPLAAGDSPVVVQVRALPSVGQQATGQSAPEATPKLAAEVSKVQVTEAPKAVGYWRMVLAGAMGDAGQRTDPEDLAQVEPPRIDSSAASGVATPAGEGRLALPEKVLAKPAEPQVFAAVLSETRGEADLYGEADRGEAKQESEDSLTQASPKAERAEQRPAPASPADPRLPVDPAVNMISEVSSDSANPSRDLTLGLAKDVSGHSSHTVFAQSEKPEVVLRAASIERSQTESGLEMTEIRLDPEELGRLRITLEGEGEAIRVRVEVERPESLEFLRRNIDRLAETLREAGYSQSDMQFSAWSGQRQSPSDQNKAEFDRDVELAGKMSPTPIVPPRAVIASEGLNLRL